jgi:hypothetical protein
VESRNTRPAIMDLYDVSQDSTRLNISWYDLCHVTGVLRIMDAVDCSLYAACCIGWTISIIYCGGALKTRRILNWFCTGSTGGNILLGAGFKWRGCVHYGMQMYFFCLLMPFLLHGFICSSNFAFRN